MLGSMCPGLYIYLMTMIGEFLLLRLQVSKKPSYICNYRSEELTYRYHFCW